MNDPMSAIALGRRIDLTREPDVTIGGTLIRPTACEVVAGGRRIRLQPRVMQVLIALARAGGEAVSREALSLVCWGDVTVGEDALSRCIQRLRRLSETEASGAFAIETIPRVGYRLVEAEMETADPHPAAMGKPRPPILRPRWIWAAAVLVVLCLTAGGLWILRDRPRPPERSAKIRVAVLPFDTLGQDPAARQFAAALPARIIQELSEDQIVTISPIDSMALRGPRAETQAARLGVGLILDGFVEGDGKSLKVQVRLEEPRAHVTLWSKAFDGTVQDPDILRDRIAVRATWVTEMAVSTRLNTVRNDDSVMAEILEGEDEFAHENGGRSLAIARDLVARAPGFETGHLLLADALIANEGPVSDMPIAGADQAVAESARQSRIALALDPKDGAPYAQLSNDLPISAWRERERWLQKGFSIDPNNLWLAANDGWWLLAEVGRTQAAVEILRSASRTDPLFGGINEGLATELADSGRGNEAAEMIASVRRRFDFWDAPINDFHIALETHNYGRAMALLDDPALRRSIGDRPGVIDGLRARVRALSSADPNRMRSAALSVPSAAEKGPVAQMDAAVWLAALGDVDGAFREADRALSPATLKQPANLTFGITGGTRFLFVPNTAAMRRDPRFMALAARIGLVDYWRSTGHWPDFCAEPGLPYNCKAG